MLFMEKVSKLTPEILEELTADNSRVEDPTLSKYERTISNNLNDLLDELDWWEVASSGSDIAP